MQWEGEDRKSSWAVQRSDASLCRGAPSRGAARLRLHCPCYLRAGRDGCFGVTKAPKSSRCAGEEKKERQFVLYKARNEQRGFERASRWLLAGLFGVRLALDRRQQQTTRVFPYNGTADTAVPGLATGFTRAFQRAQMCLFRLRFGRSRGDFSPRGGSAPPHPP